MDISEILNPPFFFCLVVALAFAVYLYTMRRITRRERAEALQQLFPSTYPNPLANQPTDQRKDDLYSRVASGEFVQVYVKGQIYIPRETIEQIALVKQYIPSSAKPVESEKPSEQTPKHKPLIRRVTEG